MTGLGLCVGGCAGSGHGQQPRRHGSPVSSASSLFSQAGRWELLCRMDGAAWPAEATRLPACSLGSRRRTPQQPASGCVLAGQGGRRQVPLPPGRPARGGRRARRPHERGGRLLAVGECLIGDPPWQSSSHLPPPQWLEFDLLSHGSSDANLHARTNIMSDANLHARTNIMSTRLISSSLWYPLAYPCLLGITLPV
ncbi:hypothetical protein PVAP13_4KG189981 [Panicum virgatum]|uniref:Uncharacterized protein n=1 Tax=Panicum virgatum TaxID=38727 RepID=A0A8T0TN96_PANVG|nr:hypothetical protein PVAP13_4KG189981 [Panicum virgatum]